MRFRIVALVAIAIGAIGSVGSTVWAGRTNPSVVLAGMFVTWVLLPFVMMGWMASSAKTRPMALYFLMGAVALLSMLVYVAVALHPPRQMAAPFLLAPLVSWVMLGVGAVLGRDKKS